MTTTGTLTTIYNFCFQTECADGYNPLARLIQGTNGDLYGTTGYGGATTSFGTVFSLSLGLAPPAQAQTISRAGAAAQVSETPR
jgi:uncharacterized repeat protein (TIGR03803 family)